MARGRAAADAALAALVEASRDAVARTATALPLFDALGGAGDLAPRCAQLTAQLGADELVVALEGRRRLDALAALVDAPRAAGELAPGVRLRLVAADELAFDARWPDGRREGPPPDRRDELAAALSLLERAVADEEARAAALADERDAAERALAHARDELARLEADARAATIPTAMLAARAWPATTAAPATIRSSATTAAPTTIASSATTAAPTTTAKRARLVAMWLWLVTLLRALFGRAAAPALPAPVDDGADAAAAAAARARRLTAATEARDGHAHAFATLERDFATARTRAAKLAAERDQRRRALDDYRAAERRRLVARLWSLLTDPGAATLEVDVRAPDLPRGIVVLVRPTGELWHEPASATITVDDDAPARAALLGELSRLRDRRPTELGRRAAALACSCRNRIVDVAERARHANDQRLGELVARRIAARDAFEQQALATAHLALARGAEQVVDAAATQLERLVDEARQAWEQRIDSCAGLEQLRAEVAAIEDGAAHRLSLTCDELRETMTVQLVRLVLDQSRPLRQELLRKRLEVARGRSPKAEETFEDIRFVFPVELDKAFAPLRAPGIGELLSSERGLFDPLFRTLSREKRDVTSRLRARVDDVARTTARELYASTVYISPLLHTRFRRLVDELLRAHERWLEAREGEERRAYEAERARLAPALALVDGLAAAEQTLARLLEAAGDR